jgi:hypothetical protein
LTSCNFFISGKKEIKIKRKTIDGIEYMFENNATYNKSKFGFACNNWFKNEITFFGMDKPINKVIHLSDFEKNMKIKNKSSFHVDSVSFNVDSQKDEIDLIYYLTADYKQESLTITLSNKNENWILR